MSSAAATLRGSTIDPGRVEPFEATDASLVWWTRYFTGLASRLWTKFQTQSTAVASTNYSRPRPSIATFPQTRRPYRSSFRHASLLHLASQTIIGRHSTRLGNLWKELERCQWGSRAHLGFDQWRNQQWMGGRTHRRPPRGQTTLETHCSWQTKCGSLSRKKTKTCHG